MSLILENDGLVGLENNSLVGLENNGLVGLQNDSLLDKINKYYDDHDLKIDGLVDNKNEYYVDHGGLMAIDEDNYNHDGLVNLNNDNDSLVDLNNDNDCLVDPSLNRAASSASFASSEMAATRPATACAASLTILMATWSAAALAALNDVFTRSKCLYPRGHKSFVTSCLSLQKTSKNGRPSIGFRDCALTVKSLLLLAREVLSDEIGQIARAQTSMIAFSSQLQQDYVPRWYFVIFGMYAFGTAGIACAPHLKRRSRWLKLLV